MAGEVLWSGVRDGEVDQGDGLSGILLGPGEVVGIGHPEEQVACDANFFQEIINPLDIYDTLVSQNSESNKE